MKLDKRNILKILFIIFVSVLFYAFTKNYKDILMLLRNIISAFSPIIIGLCVAFVLNLPMSACENAIDKIKSKRFEFLKKIKRPLSIILSVIFVGLILTVFLMLIIPEIKKTAIVVAAQLPDYMDKLNDFISSYSENFALPYDISEKVDWNNISSNIITYIKDYGSALIDKTIGITSGIFSVAVNIIIGLVFSVYVLSSKEKIGKICKKMLYSILKKEQTDTILRVSKMTSSVFSKFVAGQCTEAMILGMLCYIGMSIFNLPYSVMISSLITLSALVPIFGAIIGTAMGAVMICFISPMKAIWFVVFIIVLQQFESNLIYPRVVGKSVGLPGIWVLFSVTIGGNLFGIIGLLTAVPVCSVLYCLLREFTDRQLSEKQIEL